MHLQFCQKKLSLANGLFLQRIDPDVLQPKATGNRDSIPDRLGESFLIKTFREYTLRRAEQYE